MAEGARSPFRPELANLVPYEPGRPIELVRHERGLTGRVVKLASNEGSFGPVPAALEAIRRLADEANRYPDGGLYTLRAALAERHGLGFDQVVIGNGVDAVLNYLALAMLAPGDEVVFGWPSFPVYLINAVKMGATPVRVGLAADRSSYDLEALAAAVTPRTKIVYVTNPNNPTGGMVGRAALASFLEGLPGHVLPVVDEAYFEYVDEPDYPDSIAEHVVAGRRVMVLRTFSKIYGLAGLRIGYAVCPPDVTAACLKVKNAFDVAEMAQQAALASLDAGEEIARRRTVNAENRERLLAGLRAAGADVLPCVANFACIKVDDGAVTARALEGEGVIVRPLAGFGDPGAIRVTVGLADEVDAFLQALAAM